MSNLHFGSVLAAWRDLLDGIFVTLSLSFTAILLAFMIALVLALSRVYGPRSVRYVITAYVEAIRNTPLLIQLFVVFFGLPSAGIRFDNTTAALLALVVNLVAYTTEILRAGIEAVPKNQLEAGRSLGLSEVQLFRHIVITPAIKDVYPMMAGQFVIFTLSTAAVSQIAVADLFHAGSLIQAHTFKDFEVYITIGALYLLLAIVMRSLFHLVYTYSFGRRA